MKFTILATTLFLSALAAPIKDEHQTSMQLLMGEDATHFAVAVQRIDDIENDNGQVIAERQSNVIVSFDVDIDGSITVNGKPVKLGLNNVQVEAVTLNALTEEALAMSQEQLEAAYGLFLSYFPDIGIVDLVVEAAAKKEVVDDVEVTQIVLRETVTEINGLTVEQSTAVQQIFELRPAEGRVVRHKPCPADMMTGKKPCAMHAALKEGAAWVSKQPLHVRILASILSGAFMGLLIVMIVRLFMRVVSLFKYKRVAQDDTSVFITRVTMKEAEAFSGEKSELLPEYKQ